MERMGSCAPQAHLYYMNFDGVVGLLEDGVPIHAPSAAVMARLAGECVFDANAKASFCLPHLPHCAASVSIDSLGWPTK